MSSLTSNTSSTLKLAASFDRLSEFLPNVNTIVKVTMFFDENYYNPA